MPQGIEPFFASKSDAKCRPLATLPVYSDTATRILKAYPYTAVSGRSSHVNEPVLSFQVVYSMFPSVPR